MKGVIYNALEDMIVEQAGDEVLEQIYAEAEFASDAPPFVGPDTYPDADLSAMIEQLARKTDTPAGELVHAFGCYLFGALAARFPVFLEGVATPLEFLETVNDVIHVEVKKLFDDATPPLITVERTGDGQARLLYRSPRRLCRLLEGLLDGVADHYHRRASYRHHRCMHEGAGECVLDIAFED